jgi:hypothetical protein
VVAGPSEYLYVARPIRREMVTEGLTAAEAEALGRQVAYLRRLGEQGVGEDAAIVDGIMRAELHPDRVACAGRDW